eukprot:g283.t1
MDSTSWWKGMAYGSLCSMVADCLTLPIDVTKTRLQISGSTGGKRLYNGIIDCATTTVKNEGVAALWKGLEPALWRQCTYGGLRYGLYSPIKDVLAPGVAKKDLPLSLKIVAGGISGTLAQAMANPTDLVKVRMMAPPTVAGTRQYKWFLPALVDILRKEGIAGLYKGVSANVGRAASLAAAEMSVYDSVKGKLVYKYRWEEGLRLHSLSALCSGFAAAWCSCPFDVCKSRLMSQPVDSAGRGTLYRGLFDCFVKTSSQEGVLALWKGFIPAFSRVGPRVVIIFILMEQLRMRFAMVFEMSVVGVWGGSTGAKAGFIVSMICAAQLCRKRTRPIMYMYLPLLLLQLFQMLLWVDVEGNMNGYNESCGWVNYTLTVATQVLVMGITFPATVWMHQSLRRWRNALSAEFEARHMSSSQHNVESGSVTAEGGSAAAAKGQEQRSNAIESLKDWHDKTVKDTRKIMFMMKVIGIAVCCGTAVHVMYFSIAAHLEWARGPFCTSIGPWHSLSWPFLEIVPYPPLLKPMAAYIGDFFHMDGVWWAGSILRMMSLIVWGAFLGVTIRFYRGEGDRTCPYKKGFMFQCAMYVAILSLVAILFVAGPEAGSVFLGGPLGCFGATTLFGIIAVCEGPVLSMFRRFVNVANVKGLEGPRLALDRRALSTFPFPL